MARANKQGVIDGFSSVQAVKRATSHGKRPAARPSPETPPPSAPSAADKAEAGYRSTALPDRHDIICYECGFSFTISGRLRDTFCPKCRHELKVTDEVIDGEWSGAVKTIGTIRVTESGVIKSGELIALDIVLAGDARKASINACRRLELHEGARFSIKKTKMRDLAVPQGETFSTRGELACESVDVGGSLRASLHASAVVVQKGGCLRGKVRTKSLAVHDGGALIADIAMNS